MPVKFTIQTLFVLLSVFAVSAACFGGLVNASRGKMSEVLLFIPVTAAAPLAVTVTVFYVLKLGDWLSKKSRNQY